MDEGAVFVLEWDDVGDGSEGGEGRGFEEEVFEFFGDAWTARVDHADGPGQLEGNAGAAEVRIGISRFAAEAGVDDDVALGEEGRVGVVGFAPFMVVGDDEMDAAVG